MIDEFIYGLVRSGMFRQMRGREALTLVALLAESVSSPNVWFHVSISSLSKLTGQSTGTVHKAVVELRDRGLLHYTPGVGRFNLSAFCIPLPAEGL